MAEVKSSLSAADNSRYKVATENISEKNKAQKFYWLACLAIICAIWQVGAMSYSSDLILPTPWKTMLAFIEAALNPKILVNLLITLRRVITGFLCAVIIGVPLGYLMGYSAAALRTMDPLISSLRQIPIMAWVPLTIMWFGLGDGPTVFLIAFSGLFPIILNTIAGVQSISQDYYNAALSMGAGPMSIFSSVIFPGSLPDILTGMRIAVSAGWMSVI